MHWIILTAIVMMVSSALISYFLVRRHEPIILELKNKMQDKQALIRDVWSTINRQENRADISILLSLLKAHNSEEVNEIKKLYLVGFSGLNSQSNAIEIATAVILEREQSIKRIDSLYLEELEIQEKISEMERKNKIYSDIAFFMQILSLVIIIARKDIPE